MKDIEQGFGSEHWFRTLVSQMKHIGEIMQKGDSDNVKLLIKDYGEVIENNCKELIKWQETKTSLK